MNRILLYLFLCVVLVGCRKDGPTPPKPIEKFLRVSETGLTLTNAQNSSEIKIYASVEWTATSSDPDWLSATPTQGSGDATITIRARENTTKAERKGKITISSSAGEKYVEVTNPAPNEDDKYLSVSSTDLTLTNAQNSSEIEISASVEWTVVPSAWLTVTPISGTGSATLTITANENNTDGDRKGQIAISSSVANPIIKVTNSAPKLTVERESYKFNTPTDLKITSNTSWTIDPSAEASWCTFSTLSGKGDATVVMTPSSTTESKPAVVKIKYNTKSVDVSIAYDRANVAPSAPVLSAPMNNAIKVTLSPSFSWQASTDGNGDAIKYKLYVSRWPDAMSEHEEETTSTSASLAVSLEPRAKYYWKVEASDTNGSTSESEIYSFTTDVGARYADGEVRTYQESSSGHTPVYLVFMGDGFIAEDFNTGGVFDQRMTEAIEGFFDIEPYKTYRNYFTVYKVAAHSVDRGASVTSEGISVNTAFSSVLDGNTTGISCDYDKVNLYARKTGLTEYGLNQAAVIVAINIDRYGGMCRMTSFGSSIAMCPIDESSPASMNGRFKRIINHEAGGHGYGRLMDEYYDIFTGSIIGSGLDSEIKKWKGFPTSDPTNAFYQNLTLSSNPGNAPWKDFINRAEYAGVVGMYEGGCYHEKDVWRPEENSCMNDNIEYYNVASRYAIYKRIMTTAGRSHSIDDFIRNDKVKANPFARRASKAGQNFIPLAPPIMVR